MNSFEIVSFFIRVLIHIQTEGHHRFSKNYNNLHWYIKPILIQCIRGLFIHSGVHTFLQIMGTNVFIQYERSSNWENYFIIFPGVCSWKPSFVLVTEGQKFFGIRSSQNKWPTGIWHNFRLTTTLIGVSSKSNEDIKVINIFFQLNI